MKTCRVCGAQCEDGVNFCRTCGAQFSALEGGYSAPDNPYAAGTEYSGEGGYDYDPSDVPAIPNGFGDAIQICFRKYASFKGRASRSEYWYFFLLSWLINVATNIADAALGENLVLGLVEIVIGLALLCPSISVMVRRFHDTNHSGWLWWLAPGLALFGAAVGYFATGQDPQMALGGAGLAMLAAGFVFFVIFCQKGAPGPNKYGPAPVKKF